MGQRRTKGDGSIYQRSSDGRWVGVIDLGWVGGRRVRRSVTAPTLRELRPKFRELQARVAGGVTDEDETVKAWFTYWLDQVAARRVRPRTLATYRGYVETWVVPHLGRHRLSKLRPEHLEALYDTMREAGRSDATVRQVHAIVKRALKDAVQRQRLVRNPADVAEPPPVGRGAHAHLSVEEAKAVLLAAPDPSSLARLTVALLLGLRQSEALGLRWTDIWVGDDGWGRLVVERGVQRVTGRGLVVTDLKTASSRRTVPLIPGVSAALEQHRAATGGVGYVFGGARPVDPRKDYQAWREACLRAGVTPVPLHGARASTASILRALDVPERVIADVLGHAQVATTQAHYIRSDEAQRAEALSRLGGLLPELPGA